MLVVNLPHRCVSKFYPLLMGTGILSSATWLKWEVAWWGWSCSSLPPADTGFPVAWLRSLGWIVWCGKDPGWVTTVQSGGARWSIRSPSLLWLELWVRHKNEEKHSSLLLGKLLLKTALLGCLNWYLKEVHLVGSTSYYISYTPPYGLNRNWKCMVMYSHVFFIDPNDKFTAAHRE